jgi:hypothetical protein
MGRWAAVGVLAMAACGGGTSPATGEPDAGPADAGQALVVPPSQTFTTSRGTLTGPDAFALSSAQTVIQQPDGGIGVYAGFQLSDVPQCIAADGDGGSGVPAVTHVLSGFVRRLDGAAVQPGSYAVGMTDGNQVQAYVQLVEMDRDSGGTVQRLAVDGSVILDVLDGGHMHVGFDVTLGDPASQEQLPLSGTFDSDSCTP